jgi:hypothetical protein
MIPKFLKPLALASACALFLSATALAQTNGNMNGNTNGNTNGNANGNMHTSRRNPSPGTPRRVHRGRNTHPGTRRGPINSNNGNSNSGNSNSGNSNNGNSR